MSFHRLDDTLDVGVGFVVAHPLRNKYNIVISGMCI